MFGFDMFVHGVRGDQLPESHLNEDELEVFGVDWEALRDEQILQSQRQNNPQRENWSSWVGQVGPPENLNEVFLEPPLGGLLPHDSDVDLLDRALQAWMHGMQGSDETISLWIHALACAQVINGDSF